MEDDPPDVPRRHGLHGPWDVLQFVAAFAYVLFGVTFFLLHAPLVTPSLFQAAIVLFFGTAMPLSVGAYIIAATVPCHDVSLDERYHAARAAPRGKRMCFYCQRYVFERSKHCHACHKCVQDFDHHCRWLNHCVGDRNYTEFAVFLGSTTCIMFLQVALGLFFFIEYFVRPQAFLQRVRIAWDPAATQAGAAAIAAFIFIILVVEGLSALMIGHLMFLHIHLNYRGISTYQRILELRRESRERKAERERIGMPEPNDPEDTPMCHELAIYQFQRNQRRAAESASAQPPALDLEGRPPTHHGDAYAVPAGSSVVEPGVTNGNGDARSMQTDEGSYSRSAEDTPDRGVSPHSLQDGIPR